MTEDQIVKQVMALDGAHARQALIGIVNALWGGDDDKQWSADTLDEIAHILHIHNLTPG